MKKKRLITLLMTVTLTSIYVVPAFAAEDVTEPVDIIAKEGEKKTEEVGDVDVTRNSNDDSPVAVYVASYGGDVEVKTGDITGSGELGVECVYVRSDNGGQADVSVGNIETNDYGVVSLCDGGNAEIKAGDIKGSGKQDVTGIVARSESGGKVDVAVRNIETNGVGIYAHSENGGSTNINTEGDIKADVGGVVIYACDAGATSNVIVNGNIISKQSGGFIQTSGKGAEGSLTVNGDIKSDAEGIGVVASDGSKSVFVVNGDVITKNTDGTALYIDAKDEGNVEVTVTGTVKGGSSPIVLSNNTDIENVSVTIWKVEPNSNGVIAGMLNGSSATPITQSVDFEQKINYIIRLEDASDADLSAQDTAHEGEKVILKVDVKDGYELVNAYNGMDEKVPLVKDANGDWYVIVPKGGGVYLSVELRKKDSDKKDDDDKKDNNVIAATTSTTGATYASAEAFASAGVSMIASAAPGSTVTIDATSFTSLPASIVMALMARPDVTFVFTYMFNGVIFKVTIPAGINLTELLNTSGGIDFASLVAYTSTIA